MWTLNKHSQLSDNMAKEGMDGNELQKVHLREEKRNGWEWIAERGP